MNNTAVPTDTKTFRRDAAKLREQALERYRRDPAKWKAAVRKWREAHEEYSRSYSAWWHLQNPERRLVEMRAYNQKRRELKRQSNG